MLLGFRKKAGLTQEKVAQQLGISQQSYAAFEAHPESASVDRLFRVLRLFAVEMRLSSTSTAPVPAMPATAAQKRAAPGRAPTRAAKRDTASANGKNTPPKPRAKSRTREDW